MNVKPKDVAAGLGFCSFTVGLWMWFPPAALVAGGVVLMLVAAVGHFRGNP